MSTAEPARRPALTRVIAFAWLAILTVLAALDYIVVRDALHDPQRSADREAIAATRHELNGIASRLESFAAQNPGSQATLASSQQGIEQRLTQLSREITARVPAEDFQSLRDRVQAVEKQAMTARRSVPRPPSTNTTVAAPVQKLPLLQPPFSIIGIELRGSQRFLSIAPFGATAIGELRMLRPGDSESGWRLDALGDKTAQFTVDGVHHQLTLPQAPQ